MVILRIAAAFVDDLTRIALGAIWRVAFLALIFLPIWWSAL